MFQRLRAKRSDGLVGIEASSAGLAIAQVKRAPNNSLALARCDFVSRDAISSDGQTLAERIQALDLKGAQCNWVLPNLEYSLLLVEAPNVPAEELREAMRWRIKDLISFSVEDASIDVFPLPADASRGGHKMVYVVVTERQQVKQAIEASQLARLRLQSIDIGELALRNLADLVTNDQRAVALVRLRQGIGSLALVKQEQLYLSRQFELAYNGGLLDDLPGDALVLELQRSLDYYERQMGQVAPAKIIFCGENISNDKIESIAPNLPCKSQCLDLRDFLAGAEQWDEAIVQLCLGAIGGALRQEAA